MLIVGARHLIRFHEVIFPELGNNSHLLEQAAFNDRDIGATVNQAIGGISLHLYTLTRCVTLPLLVILDVSKWFLI